MTYRVAIIGRPNVGKSTLFNRLAGRKLALVDDMPGLTRDRREAGVKLGKREVVLIDTAGLEEGESLSITERMRQQSEAALHDCDLALFIIDARKGVTPADACARLWKGSRLPQARPCSIDWPGESWRLSMICRG